VREACWTVCVLEMRKICRGHGGTPRPGQWLVRRYLFVCVRCLAFLRSMLCSGQRGRVIDTLLGSAAFDASVTYWEMMITSKLSLPARFTCLQFAVPSIVHVLVFLNMRMLQTGGEKIASLLGVSTACMLGSALYSNHRVFVDSGPGAKKALA